MPRTPANALRGPASPTLAASAPGHGGGGVAVSAGLQSLSRPISRRVLALLVPAAVLGFGLFSSR